MEQAKADLEYARESMSLGHFNWVCFVAQQAAEKAAKARHLQEGTVVWGHSVRELLEAFPAEGAPSQDIREAGRSLDRHYVPSRYPNAHPSGAPRQQYTEADARQAVADAEKVVKWCDQGFSPEP
jgi:HEPN domain-containing protein